MAPLAIRSAISSPLPPAKVIRMHQDDQILVFERNNFIFAFNFHPSNPQLELFIPAPVQGDYQAVLSSDDWAFGGNGRISKEYVYHTQDHDDTFGDGFKIYLPARTAVVLKKL